ncbi:BsuPI-related putative proteinase inhibitor [Alkalihalobacillus sp. BA299]|uniref:BsuPI-related putative proteinase inhibitor n=1 Tax=Alkalihalobacillus sp. BA299 TaxID=2815938 RepID=UPI001ADD2A03|nr:BsuPI-related putative proteinase inhibitor [Alkalihalobacillus sp. BA299]
MKVLLLLVLAFMLSGCGLGNETTGQDPNSGASEIAEGGMAVSLMEKNSLIFNYEITNQSDEVVTMEFSSSQRIDYSVTTKDGKEIYLFSSVATFLQALGEEELKSGEKLEYVIDLNELNLEEGEYLLDVWMTPRDGTVYKVVKAFIVE